MAFTEIIEKIQTQSESNVDTGPAVSHVFHENRTMEDNKKFSFTSGFATGICHGLKSASAHRSRIQKEIEDLLDRKRE